MAITTLKERLALAMAGPPKVTQADLARACKISAPSVNDWLSGKSKSMDGANLLAAARLLSVSPDWLATGRGPMRLNESPTPTGPDDFRPFVTMSQDTILDPDMLHEALTLLVHDEGHAGEYGPRRKAARLAELYARVVADGGRLTDRHNAEFEAEVRQRAKGGLRGNELAERRADKRRNRTER